MQQWIPRTQTLEPKIWGQVGPRQGLYIGLGVFGAIFFLIALAPFGLGPRISGALLAMAAGVAVGFMRIKGLSPERYLMHRLRFALTRQGLGVRQAPDAQPCHVELDLQTATKQREVSPRRAASPGIERPRKMAPARVVSAARWNESTVQASPFGLVFYLVALGSMGVATVYLMGGPVPWALG